MNEYINELISKFKKKLFSGYCDGNILFELYDISQKNDLNIDNRKITEELISIIYYGKVKFSIVVKTAIYSYIFSMYKCESYMIRFMDEILESDELSWNNLYYLYSQIKRLTFMNKEYNTTQINIRLWNLLRKVYEKSKEEMDYPLDRIPEDELNGKLQLIITSQFLLTAHGPTKTALDRACVIKKHYGNVMIINTAELYPIEGEMYFWGSVKGSYIEEYSEKDAVDWKNYSIPFFQCDTNMPNIDVIKVILDNVRKLKPKVVVCVGGDSLLAAYINELIPVLVVGCTQSNLNPTLCDYQVADDKQIEIDKNVLEQIGYVDNVIRGKFTFSLRDSLEMVSREQFGLSDKDFVISMVGLRLSEEIDNKLLEMLEDIQCDQLRIIIIGKYDNMEMIGEKYPKLYRKIINMGFCEDTIARIKLSDIYLNPVRKGGATSAVEALSVGVPVVTVDYGDVAGTVGTDFVYESLEECKVIIDKYIHDPEFYENQSKKALLLAEELLDSDREFVRVLEEYLYRRKNQQI